MPRRCCFSFPAGNRNTDGRLNNVGLNGNWWLSASDGADAWYRNLNYDNSAVSRNTFSQRTEGRCASGRDLTFFIMKRSKRMDNLVLKEDITDISLEDVFSAYFQCRKNKRNKLECLEYDLDYEIHLIKLWEDIKKGVYQIKPLSVFIVDKPVKREIFASSFQDRIVHHLIVM